MAATGIAEAKTLLRDLRYIDPMWCGTAFLPCWRSELDIHIDPDEGGITPRQLSVLRALLSYPQDIRAEFERALFDYYQTDVDGSYCEYGPDAKPVLGIPLAAKAQLELDR